MQIKKPEALASGVTYHVGINRHFHNKIVSPALQFTQRHVRLTMAGTG